MLIDYKCLYTCKTQKGKSTSLGLNEYGSFLHGSKMLRDCGPEIHKFLAVHILDPVVHASLDYNINIVISTEN